MFHGKIYGFRLRFSQQNQSIDMSANGYILKIGGSLPPQLEFWVPYLETKPSTANLQTHLNPLPTCTGILARLALQSSLLCERGQKQVPSGYD